MNGPHRGSSQASNDYVCPGCKGALRLDDEAYVCLACQDAYPIRNGIPDFVLDDLAQSRHPILRSAWAFDILSAIYETWFWYPFFINVVCGLGSTSRKRILRTLKEMVHPGEGIILDVACGPGTLGRRMASPSIAVHGIDISMGMLRKGVLYAKRDRIQNMRFARAEVEGLPFGDTFFDGAICGGALHLFRDTHLALQEIGRTMKRGAPLAVTTIVAGNRGILRFPPIRQYIEQRQGTHVFHIRDLEQYLYRAGFEGFEPKMYGSLLVFRAQKTKN